MIGHRGVSFSDQTKISENSLAAYRYAIDCGATHIETDLKVTADNHIVIMHDDTLNTSPKGTGVGVESSTLGRDQNASTERRAGNSHARRGVNFSQGETRRFDSRNKIRKGEYPSPPQVKQLQKHDMFDQWRRRHFLYGTAFESRRVNSRSSDGTLRRIDDG